MRAHRVVSGGALRRSGPALRVTVDRPGSVRRRSGRRPAPLLRLRDAIDWPFLGFTLAVAATVFVLVYVALGRMA